MNLDLPITSEMIGLIAVFVTVFTFAGLPIYCKLSKRSITFQELMVRALSASSLPTAIVIILCAIDVSLLAKLGGLFQVYIALAGLSLVYVSSVALFAPLDTKKQEPKAGS
ncbi:MAG: hypothetical protein GXP09_10790 [Gammaproteobacteria bacterium]|nr:hypothetical protein [Gammaproteobacteria bacterium]